MAKFTLRNVRVAFPTFGEPEKHPSDTKPNPERYFSANYLIDPTDPVVEQIEAAQLQEMANTFTGGDLVKAGPLLKAAKAIGKVCLHDGNTKDPDTYTGYADKMFVSARTSEKRGKPKVYGTGGKAAGEQPASLIYGGCYVNAIINVYAYGGKNGIPKGVSAGLGDVQKVRDGDAFGGGAPRATDDDFGSIDDPDNDPLLGND